MTPIFNLIVSTRVFQRTKGKLQGETGLDIGVEQRESNVATKVTMH